MKTVPSLRFLTFVFSLAFLDTAWAQPLTVTTIAGGFKNAGYINGVGTNALFEAPSGISADPAGNLYVIDYNAIRKISPDLTVNTIAGLITFGGYHDASTNALFQNPWDLVVDKNGTIYVADWGNSVVRKISPLGIVTTLAGNGTKGYIDATGTNAEFSNVYGITVDSSGNVYVTDAPFFSSQFCLIRKITPEGVVSTLAGGAQGYNDGVGANAQFYSPQGLAVDSGGTVYVADGFGIRKVSPDGTVATWAGSQNNNRTELDGIGANAGFYGARGIALDRSGGAYVTDENGGTIRYVSSAGVVSTVAGLANQVPTNPYNDGVGSDARFISPYGIAVDTAGNVYFTDEFARTILEGARPPLSPLGSFSESPGGTPVRSSNPWQFTAYFTNIVSDLRLRVQSTTTTNIEGSWTDLPDGGQMADKDGNWTLNTTDVPAGIRYFRVVAAAPGYPDSASTAVGPETVLDGIAPFGFFKWQTTYPNETGTLWVFNIDESSVISGLNLRVQSNQDGNGWNDLSGGQMTRFGSTWALNTTNVPTGQVSFRVVASAPNYMDRISASLGPFPITPPLLTVMKSSSTGGTYTLKDIMGPDPQKIYFDAVQAAVVKFGCVNTVQYNSAVNLAGEQYAAAVLQIETSQNVPILAVNMGQNSTLILRGGIIGDVSLISQDGSGVVSNDGGSLTHDAGTMAAVVSNDGGSLISKGGYNIIGENSSGLISQDGGGLISQDGGGLISQDGGGLISQDGSGFTGQAGAAVSVKSKTPLHSRPKGSGPTQPAFTGQMTINGNYSQFPGTALIIGIAGTNTLTNGAQQYDQLVVGGQANFLGGTIAFGLFDPDDQTNLANTFQPPDGATFDVVVASNIVVNALHLLGPVWGDGLFFKGGVVTLTNGLQAVRLMATHIPPQIFIQNAGPELHLLYGTNYTGYPVQRSPTLSPPNWTTFSTGTNVVVLSRTNASGFFRLSKP